MSGNHITIVGNLTADPELRFVPSGAAVVNFTVAHTPRYKDQSGTWHDGTTTFMKCSLWKQPAENVAESLRKGNRVIVTGKLTTSTWETREGDKRTSVEVEVEEVGPSLKNATAVITKTVNRNGLPGAGPSQAAEDPWAATTPTRGAFDEVPF